MRLLFRFSKEHESLPDAELEAVFEGERLKHEKVLAQDRFRLFEVQTEENSFVRRLALTLEADDILGVSKKVGLLAGTIFDHISDCDTFRVVSESKKVESELGGLLHNMGLKVDLKRPDVRVACHQIAGEYYGGVMFSNWRDFEGRKPQLRPYFHPTSLHPKLARVLVNLARVREGDTMLDPFCGTGGILIEAGLIGLNVIGWDIRKELVDGTKMNLKHYGLRGRVEQEDALRGKADADAVVTDMPYGRSSYSSKQLKELYTCFLENAKNLVTDGGCIVLMSPEDYELPLAGHTVLESYSLRVHKSLTRRITVLRH
ncbi:MAG: TRM11 family methyltransferase [Candidatus Altiarchaeota archaeon]